MSKDTYNMKCIYKNKSVLDNFCFTIMQIALDLFNDIYIVKYFKKFLEIDVFEDHKKSGSSLKRVGRY